MYIVCAKSDAQVAEVNERLYMGHVELRAHLLISTRHLGLLWTCARRDRGRKQQRVLMHGVTRHPPLSRNILAAGSLRSCICCPDKVKFGTLDPAHDVENERDTTGKAGNCELAAYTYTHTHSRPRISPSYEQIHARNVTMRARTFVYRSYMWHTHAPRERTARIFIRVAQRSAHFCLRKTFFSLTIRDNEILSSAIHAKCAIPTISCIFIACTPWQRPSSCERGRSLTLRL